MDQDLELSVICSRQSRFLRHSTLADTYTEHSYITCVSKCALCTTWSIILASMRAQEEEEEENAKLEAQRFSTFFD